MRKFKPIASLLAMMMLLLAFNFTVAYAAMAAPTKLAAAVLGSSSVKLTWKASSGASKYQVYKGTSTSSMSLSATCTTVSYTVSSLTSSTKYYFEVKALPSSGAASAFSSIVNATTSAGIAAPTGVKAAAAGSSQITVSWGAVSGATGYTVYRASSAAGAYGKIMTTTAKSYANTGLAANTVYYYKVRAVNAKGEGIYSAAASARTYTAAPTGLKAAAQSSSSIKLTWTAVSGATKYYIYRAPTSTGTYSKIGEAPVAASPAFTNTGLAATTSYYYKVSALNSGGQSALSAAASARTWTAAPTGLKAAAQSSSSIKLTWTAVSGATKYYIFRAPTSTGTYSKIGEAPVAASPAFTNTGLAATTSYYYKVSALNSGGQSALSAAATTSTFTAAPTGLKAAAQSSSSIKLTWTGVSGATKYYIYRAATSTGTYSKIGEAPVAASPAFTNTGLAATTSYYYKVSALNSGGQSALSAAATTSTFTAAPTGLKAAAQSSSSIKLTWTGVSGATKYYIYRAATSTGTYSKIGEAFSATYTNTGLTANTSYYYKVSALNSGGQSAQSAYATAKTQGSSIPAPSNLQCDPSYYYVNLSWNAVAGAVSYNIYMATSAAGTYAYQGNIADTSCSVNELNPNTPYYFKVSSVGVDGEGPMCTFMMSKTLALPTPPAAPSFFCSACVDKGNNLTEADFTPSASLGYYRLYDSTDGTHWNLLVDTTPLTFQQCFTYTDTTGNIDYVKFTAFNGPSESAGKIFHIAI